MHTLFFMYMFSLGLAGTPEVGQAGTVNEERALGEFRLALLGPTVELRYDP